MRPSNKTLPPHGGFILFGLLVGVLALVAGCSIVEIHKQTTLIDNLGTLTGKIRITSDQKGPVIVLRFLDEDGIPVLKQRVIANTNGEYEFTAAPGKNYIAAFIDANHDGKYQSEEHGNYHGAPTTIDIVANQSGTTETITISGPIPKPATEIKPIDNSLAIWKNIGTVVTLTDPRFTSANYSNGLWRPVDFLKKAEGGLFFLQEYNSNKIPVIFVHGVNNGPTLWARSIESIHDTRFQPWVYYYPSGFRLDMLSNYLVEAVQQLQFKYGFSEFYIVAHSMGGLVSKSFVKKYIERNQENIKKIGLLMTVNSPMAGVAAAESGVNFSPIVIPSWRDIAPGSAFLRGLHNWNWPDEIPYHLVISYLDNKNGDGVIPLQSQVPWKLQTEATRTYIFNQEHTEIIDNNEFHALLNTVLEKQRQKRFD